jgi:hypothetical protein
LLPDLRGILPGSDGRDTPGTRTGRRPPPDGLHPRRAVPGTRTDDYRPDSDLHDGKLDAAERLFRLLRPQLGRPEKQWYFARQRCAVRRQSELHPDVFSGQYGVRFFAVRAVSGRDPFLLQRSGAYAGL